MAASKIQALVHSTLNTRRRQLAVAGALGAVVLILAARRRMRFAQQRLLQSSATEVTTNGKHATGRKRNPLDKEFFRRLRRLLRIVMPGLRSKEFGMLALHTAFLVSRTFLSIYIAMLDGAMVKAIVARQLKPFLLLLGRWLLMAIPASYVNSMIRFMEDKLAIAFRSRLSKHAYNLYMSNETYYRVVNLDSRLSNADQCLTEDINRFCSQLAHLHSQLSKPLLDIALMGGQLLILAGRKTGKTSGLIPTIIATAVVWLTAKVLKLVSPPFGKMAAERARLEGELRHTHSRLIANAEEIAFLRGHNVEKSILERAYVTLVKHLNLIYWKRIFYTTLESFFMKYLWAASGMTMIAIPAFMSTYQAQRALAEGRAPPKAATDDMGERTQDFITTRRLLIDTADAIERIMSAYKDVTELSGYVSRVCEMLDVFADVSKGVYYKAQVTSDGKAAGTLSPLPAARGTIIEDPSRIKFEGVPIVSPNGDVLVASLSFEVARGQHLLITGPNGCGKSSLFRILGGLWPATAGVVYKPAAKDIFYIPQRPYLCLGTLRDQVIYPDTVADMKVRGRTDADLERIMEKVALLPIVEREGGWDAVREWKDVLSGGEKQRIGMARLFYHRPLFAILDECTSAVSIDVEGSMYTYAKELGITLLTVTHRPSLWVFHDWLLQFDGEGGVKFEQLNASTRLSLKEEKSNLERQLAGMPKILARLKELSRLLGENELQAKMPSTESNSDEDASMPTENGANGHLRSHYTNGHAAEEIASNGSYSSGDE